MNKKENEEIDSLVEKLSGSAIEFRNTTDGIIFKRLRRFFQTKQRQITRDTRLKEIFPANVNETDWYELEKIGLKVPPLRRANAFNYLSVTYLVLTFGSLLMFSILNLDLVFVVWGLPIFGFVIALAASPMLLFFLIFKRRHFPCDTIDHLVDQIISVNWTDFLDEDKKMFKELVRQENELEGRADSESGA